MSVPENRQRTAVEVEQLLSSLAGVVSARVVLDPYGRLDEVHVLASDRLHPKQVVRNVESALSAGLGLDVDRRVVSVAQVRGELRGTVEPPAAAVRQSVPEPVAGASLPRLVENRFVFVGHEVRNETNRETVCHATIARGNEHYTGTGVGANTLVGRAQAAARALFSALGTARRTQDLAFENAMMLEAHGRWYVLVAAHGLKGRNPESLTGVAVVQRSPEEAAILAGLQAANRWAGDDD